MFGSEEKVSFAEFVQELQREVEFNKKGSNYRMVTAELSDEIKQYVNQKRQNRKPLQFKNKEV